MLGARLLLVGVLVGYWVAVRAGSRRRARRGGRRMTLAGWIFLALAWGFVLGLAGYCVFRTLRDG